MKPFGILVDASLLMKFNSFFLLFSQLVQQHEAQFLVVYLKLLSNIVLLVRTNTSTYMREQALSEYLDKVIQNSMTTTSQLHLK